MALELTQPVEQSRKLTRNDAILYTMMNAPGLVEAIGIAVRRPDPVTLLNPVDIGLIGWGLYSAYETGKAIVGHIKASSSESEIIDI